MQNVIDKDLSPKGNQIASSSCEFSLYLQQLKQMNAQFSQNFLQKIKCIIDSRESLDTKLITQIVQTIIYPLFDQNKKTIIKNEKDKKYQIIKQQIEQRKKIKLNVFNYKKIVNLVDQIIDKIILFSSYKNYLDLLIVYYFIGDILEHSQKILKKILYLLIRSFNKIKQIQDTLLNIQIILSTLENINKNKYNYKYSQQTIILIEITSICFGTKIKQINQIQINQVNYLLQSLKQISIIDFGKLSIQEQILWDRIFTSVLGFYYHKDNYMEVSKIILQAMLQQKIDMQIVKLLIKQLQIIKVQKADQKWKRIFNLMSYCLYYYNQPKNLLFFQSSDSFLKIPLNYGKNFSIRVDFRNLSKNIAQQKILFKVLDKSTNNNLIITRINQQNNKIKIALLKVNNQNMCQMYHNTLTWKQNQDSFIIIQFKTENIRVTVNNQNKHQVVTSKRFIQNPSQLIIGDSDKLLGTVIKQLISVQIFQGNKLDNGLCINLQLNKYIYHQVKKIQVPWFIELIKIIGDLDIFLLVISHAFKRLKQHHSIQIENMIKLAVGLLRQFTQIKQVKKTLVNSLQRQRRLNAIFCLCWQCSNQTKNANAVLLLMQVLTIRDINNPEDELQILSNFVFWKNLRSQYQNIIIQKIKILFIQLKKQENYLQKIIRYSKKILIDAALYYREEDIMNGQQNKQTLLKLQFQFKNLIYENMILHAKQNKQMQYYYDFIETIIKMMSQTLKKFSHICDAYDVNFSTYLSFLARQLGTNLIEWHEKYQNKLLRIIRYILSVISLYQNEQKYYSGQKLKIYNGFSKFIQCDDNIIKQNLYFLAYKLLSLRPKLLFGISGFQEKGVPQIICIAWQKQFFEVIVKNYQDIDYSLWKFEQNTLTLIKLKEIFQKYNLQYMSNQQYKNLLKVYILQKQIFKHPHIELTKVLVKKLSIFDFMSILDQIIDYLSQNEKSFLSQTQISSKTSIKSNEHFYFISYVQKILILLSYNRYLKGKQCLLLLQKLLIFNEKQKQSQKIKLFYNHCVLKYILQAFKINQSSIVQPFQNQSTIISQFPSKSSITLSTKQQNKQNEYCLVNKIEKSILNCFEYYKQKISLKDVKHLLLKQSYNEQQMKQHYQMIKSNIQSTLTQLRKQQDIKFKKLKYRDGFIYKFLLPLSQNCMIDLKLLDPIKNQHQKQRKKSQHYIKIPDYDINKQTKKLFQEFFSQREIILAKVQQVWSILQQKNKYFWATFISKQIQYTLYQGTNSNNQFYLIKKTNKKPKLQLPKMSKNSSIYKTISVISQKYDINQSQSSSNIFQDARLNKKEAASCFPQTNKKQYNFQQKKKNFKVMLITSSKIYQGVLTIQGNKLFFKENQQISEEKYNKIYAYKCEMRTQQQAISENYKFQQILTQQTIIISKRYLFHDIAVQIHLKTRSYLFTFLKKDHRQAFMYLFEKQKKYKVLYRENLQQELKDINYKWQIGILNNYQYLMKFNDINGRSFNDLSQYYIFPWTVINFQSQVIDRQFMKNPKNFRDLSEPIGKINKNKWEGIKRNYQRMVKQKIQGIKPFIFGSFYSNPAIVSNYLIRINPFATQHYQLQSKQFDLADRLFYSINDNFKSLITCSGDCKQLIPQFYYFPQFLKNRNKYDLGARQNKDIVNNVILPKWASDQYQFVFKMKKFLQSQIVTKCLNSWIDLIFGVYSKKQNAEKANNLYLSDLYIDNYKNYLQSKDKNILMYFKQFGQVPDPVINYNVEASIFQGNYYDSIIHPSIMLEQFYINKGQQNGKILQITFFKKFAIVLLQKQIRLYEQQKYGQKKDFVSIKGDFEYCQLKSWQMKDCEQKKHFCLLVHNKAKKQIIGYQIKKNIFNNFSIQGGEIINIECKIDCLLIYDDFLIISDNKNLYILKNIKQQIHQQYSSKNFSLTISIYKYKYLLAKISSFTQHRAKITHLYCCENSMIVSIDQQDRVFIIQLSLLGPSIFNSFDIKCKYLQEQIIQVIVHKFGLIICRTNYSRIFMFSFLGDQIIKQKICFFSRKSLSEQQKIQDMCLMNPDMCQLVMVTNCGNIWKIDLFYLKKNKLIKPTQLWVQCIQAKNNFKKVSVERIGRFFEIILIGNTSNLTILRDQKWNMVRQGKNASKKRKFL